MVNGELSLCARRHSTHSGTAKSHEIPAVFSVNESFSKRFEFSENSRLILFECTQNREQPLQPRLVASSCDKEDELFHRAFALHVADFGQEHEAMFFLLRVTFWLTVALALLPSFGGNRSGAQAKIGASDAIAAAGAVVSDMSSFCARQPDACVVGTQAAVAIGARAQEGVRMVYDFVGDHTKTATSDPSDKTGSVTSRKLIAIGGVPTSQNTLTASDLEPTWQGPSSSTQHVPLPRKNPYRQT
jgi:hypothetical protein